MKLAIDPKLGRRIAALSLPVVAAMLSQTAINVVDHILVGRLPHAEQRAGQAALGPSLVLLWMVGGTLSAIAVGTQALSARRTGAGDPERAGQVLTNSLVVAFLASVVAATLAWLIVPTVFAFLEKDQLLLELGIPYVRWRMGGVVSMVMTASFKSFFDGLGRTRVHMYAAIVMNIVNFVLGVGLIFGYLGMPRLGVVGAGVASAFSSYIGLGMMFAWSLRPKYLVPHRYYRMQNLSAGIMKSIIRLSYPSGLATLFVMTGFFLFYKIVGRLDVGVGTPVYTAATQNIITILQLTFITCIAYGTATATLVGQSMGAGDFDLAERYAWEAVKIGMYFFGIVGLYTMLLPDSILGLLTKDVAVIAAAHRPLQICGSVEPLMVAAMVFTQALFGAGNTRFVMWVEFTLHFACLVPLAYLFGVQAGWGIVGVWLAAVVYVVLLASIMGWKFNQGGWKAIRI
ncbi:MAG TPA: MATE family efflux transporter [Polyangia bacterium]|nr:MATE family efflux transporter [Polyangia bacterium]